MSMFDCIHADKLWCFMEKLKDLAERLNRGYIYQYDFNDPENGVTKLITALYKSACANFDMEKEADYFIGMWRNNG